MNITTEQRVCEYLEKHLLDRIWNEPYKEYRTNVQPRLLTPRAVCGTYTPRYDQIDLPTTGDLYFVYSVALEEVTPFQLNVPGWVALSEYNRDNLLTFQMYTHSGIWLWRDAIYIRAGVVNNALLVAVRRDMFKKCCGSRYSPSNVYFTKYHDSDMEHSVSCTYIKVIDQATKSRAMGLMGSATMSFINGRYSKITNPAHLAVGDYVEAIVDDNVISTIVIDMQNKEGLTYNSNTTNRKTIVHVPKSVNPDNVLITHNTCDIYIYPLSTPTAGVVAGKTGLFVHKCLRADQFWQLTHNDFSVNDDLINGIAAEIGCDRYEMHVYIRSHNKKLGLVRDVNYCELLYVHNDQEIVDFLTGRGRTNFEFWTADVLEDSVYATALMDKTGHRPARDIGYFVDVLGYYNTIQLICQRVTHYKVGSQCSPTFTVPIPVVLNDKDPEDMFCIVYHNGIKLDDSLITRLGNTTGSEDNQYMTQAVIAPGQWDGSYYLQYSYLKDVKTFSIQLDASVELKEGDYITIEVFENPIVATDRRVIHGYEPARTTTFQEGVTYFLAVTNQFNEVRYVDAYVHELTADQVFQAGTVYYIKDENGEYRQTVVVIGEPVPQDTYYVRRAPIAGEAMPAGITFYTNHNRDITFTSENYLLYQVNSGTTVKDANGNQITGLNSYQLIDKSVGIWNPNNLTLTLPEDYIGRTVIYTENAGIFKVYQNDDWVIEEDKWDLISTGTMMQSETIDLPILGDVSYLVFLNGRQLIQNLDYTILESKAGNNLMRRELIIQNLIWLVKTNKVEVYAIRATTRGYQNGYVTGEQVSNFGESPFWFDNLSVLTVDGKVQSQFESFFGQVFIRSTGHRNGACYLQRSLIPNTAVDLIEKYRNDNDLSRLERLRAYFVGWNEDDIERIVIPHSHAIYSIYLNSIIRDFLRSDSDPAKYTVTTDKFFRSSVDYYTKSGNNFVKYNVPSNLMDTPIPENVTYYNKFDIVMYRDKAMFEDQFSAYKWLKNIDTVYMKQDLRYLDAYPMYHRARSNNKLVYRKLKYLFEMLLPADDVKYKDVINEQ